MLLFFLNFYTYIKYFRQLFISYVKRELPPLDWTIKRLKNADPTIEN